MLVTIFTDDLVMNIGVVFFFVLFVFICFLFVMYVVSLFKRRRYAAYQPGISIIIPAYNEEKNIGECLRSVVESHYPSKLLEILVVDDSSTDNTVKRVKELSLIHI